MCVISYETPSPSLTGARCHGRRSACAMPGDGFSASGPTLPFLHSASESVRDININVLLMIQLIRATACIVSA